MYVTESDGCHYYFEGHNRGDFKKSWNLDEDGGNRNRGGSWKMDEGGGQDRKWNNGKDDGVRRNRWQDNNDGTQRRSGPSDSSSKWRGKKADENISGSRGERKPWGTDDCSFLHILVPGIFTRSLYCSA